VTLYNTGRMSPEQVIAAFAARRQQLDRIIADLAAEKPKSRAQHHLIVGQRGMGKTMLLARIAAELRTNSELSARFIPLVFAEEQYAVDRLSKFWLNCLDSLADALEVAKDTAGVNEIDATVARLAAAGVRAAKDDQPFAGEVYEAFARIVKAGGHRPVLLVDNLQLVFERLDNGQQHSLRELLMRPGSPILIGASPSPQQQSQDYGAAFYDQFKVHYLSPLDESEMRSLLLHLAEAAERDDVRQRVLQHPARLTVLRQLTGGNPRTVLTLFFLYAEDFAPSVFGDLEGLLDRVTPLYKARFEELTPQQQVVASASLSTATGLPSSSISAQLDRLEKTGVVERTELFGETSTGYQLAERFFNIWFLMRSASRRQRREVEFLTRFLESFYEPTDVSRVT
jgi:AAA ATPase domain